MMASTSEQIRDLEGGGADRRAAKCVESSHRVRDIAEETRDANTTKKNGTRGSHNRVHHQRPLSLMATCRAHRERQCHRRCSTESTNFTGLVWHHGWLN